MASTPNHNRMSNYSTTSLAASSPRNITTISTTTLLNALHVAYTSGQPYLLDAGTSLVVNTWLMAAKPGPDGREGGTVDPELARRAYEHARRRAEDGCIVLGSLHPSTPSILAPFISTLPFATPSTLSTALSALRPFLHTVTPQNPSTPRHSALSITFTLNLAGTLTAASIALSTSGLDTSAGLLNLPSEPGYRAFDVFYYLLTSASTPAEREFLGIQSASAYTLLKRSGTVDPPSYLPAADDAASAEDWRASLRAIGIKGSVLRNLLSVLAGLLKLGDTLGYLIDSEELERICEDVGGLLGLDPEVLIRKCSTTDREVLVGGLYEALVDWVISKANEAIANKLLGNQEGDSSNGSTVDATGPRTPETGETDDDTVSITVVEIPGQTLGKAVALRGVFDGSLGINAEMMDDGVEIPPAGSSVLREMANAVTEVEADLGITGGASYREREHERDRRETVLEKVGCEAEAGSFLKRVLYPVDGDALNVGRVGRFDLATVLGSSRVWYHLALHPSDESPSGLATLASTISAWSAGTISRQLRAWRLPEWANRRNRIIDFTADFDVDEFYQRYSRLGCKEGRDGVETWLLERGWSNGEVVVGHERVWMREGAWWEAETMLDLKSAEELSRSNRNSSFGPLLDSMSMAGGMESGYSTDGHGINGSGFFGDNRAAYSSTDQLLRRQHSSLTLGTRSALGHRSIAPTLPSAMEGGDYGLGYKGDEKRGEVTYDGLDRATFNGQLDPEIGDPTVVTEQPISKSRRVWVALTWALTFWIPSFMLRYVGRMRRPDVRMAWREKLVLVFLIGLLNAIVIFYIIEFGRLLCPNYDKAWNEKEVGQHQGDDDFWVSVHGKVYDITKFWKLQHSDTNIETTTTNMQPFGGQKLDGYFMPPLIIACPGLVTDENVVLQPNTTLLYPEAIHTSGPRFEANPTTARHDINWYTNKFLPRMKEYYKGDLVTDAKTVRSEGQNLNHQWVIVHNKIYDLTDYFYTLKRQNNLPQYSFLPDDVEELIKRNPGGDITDLWEKNLNHTTNLNSLNCLNDAFYVGTTDYRKSARCQVNNYILLAFTIILCTVILAKFLAALQLGSKRRPAAQDKFVICQVPAYTEGEEQLRKGLDSLTALQYDNKRKLICVMCDGMIVGGGNDRPTPKIVLDILGVDPKIDPPALPFKSVGQGSEQLNYGKVYSGLYEYEGNVVPYLVVVKVGKESEQAKSKPGNRGKRDSQVLLLNFLNRVHHRAPMSPLELEMFHQINNIIGVDPELYEYLLMVDADTSVKEDSLNRLVASCANDAKIAGICGETSLENEGRSWWTMIQVYEYYISHHLAKAFESLFGSVTCLPGCFCMYRLRTADKGRPLIISDKVISEYNVGEVDTLHKKNLLSLGEDRYLTTLMTKHFPYMSYKFIPDAYANTAAPETWGVLVSQRRRWINSTIHNLAELVFLKEMCGFCCFSMRFVVFIDLFGTIILPATCAYLGYLIYKVATHSGQFPLISIVMLAAVYGLQALIFIIKRQWQHVGWMIIYIIAFPVYSFILPIYSFWNQDNFSWGSTRIVIGEKGNNKVVAIEDEGFDPRSIPLQRWDDYAGANNLPGRRGESMEKSYQGGYEDNAYEMDDIHSTYSSVKPASTILTGFGGQGGPYMASQSPAPFSSAHRQSTLSRLTRYADDPQVSQQRVMSMGGLSEHYQDTLSRGRPMSVIPNTDNLLATQSPSRRASRSPSGMLSSRPASTLDFHRMGHGPDDATITEAIQICLREVDLDSVTKKQVRALVEQRLQTELTGERRVFLDHQIDAELAAM
ncbi:MAG: hypothetical protein M1816_006059 [Peltula sp. TS41687]|nr:MAG: hypothetical protein M1816_006059 [Peltula sp. TS41687]